FSLQLASVLSASVLLFILYFLLRESAPLLNEIGVGSFFDKDWYPLDGEYGLTSMLLGSLYVALGAVLLATPLGVIVAVFGQYYAPPVVARIYHGMIELLAGIPSVVYGLWGLTMLVPWITGWAPPGASVLAGIIVLAMMILPLVVLTADAALAKVPANYLRSAEALGLSRWAMIYRIALPVAMPGISSGVVLQSGRALGETMAILMVTGNVVQIPSSWFQPVRTLTANIALEMSYAIGDHRLALFVSGLLLLLLTVALVSIANHLRRKEYA
ncbi:MAG: phosphate ABC transporter permease subunit PstC, partial [Thiohalomonadales bacterium]